MKRRKKEERRERSTIEDKRRKKERRENRKNEKINKKYKTLNNYKIKGLFDKKKSFITVLILFTLSMRVTNTQCAKW